MPILVGVTVTNASRAFEQTSRINKSCQLLHGFVLSFQLPELIPTAWESLLPYFRYKISSDPH